jgi:hypothetical protein
MATGKSAGQLLEVGGHPSGGSTWRRRGLCFTVAFTGGGGDAVVDSGSDVLLCYREREGKVSCGLI